MSVKAKIIFEPFDKKNHSHIGHKYNHPLKEKELIIFSILGVLIFFSFMIFLMVVFRRHITSL